MGNTIYQNCVKMLKDVKKETVNLDELESLIIRFIGGQQGTISQALHVMGATGLIEDIGNYRFKIIK